MQKQEEKHYFGNFGIRKIVRTAMLMGCILWILVLAGCGKEEALPETEDEDGDIRHSTEDGLFRSLDATVEVAAGGLYGSGVIYEQGEKGLILVTAGHVISEDVDDINVTFRDGSQVKCSGFTRAEDADCVFFTAAYEDMPTEWQENYGTVIKDRQRFDALECEKGVFLADRQAENELGCRFALVVDSWIYVEDFSQHMILLSGQAHAGMSGCGVFDGEGCFLGILCGGNDEGELAVLPYSVIESCYRMIFD